MERAGFTRRTVFASLFLGAVLLVPLPAQSGGEARSSAYGFVLQARALAAAGSDSAAASLLESSLEIDPGFSESCYLLAQLRLKRQEDTRSGIEWLRRAIASGSWVDTRAEQASLELARVLVRTRSYAQARSVLASAGARPGLGDRDDPEAALLWGQALLGQGQTEAAARYGSEALLRYPQDSRLYLQLARALRRLGRTSEALDVLSRGRRELPLAPELSLEAARLAGPRALRIQYLEEYAQRGGQDPAADALALTLQPRDPEGLFQRFLDQGGNSRLLPLDELIDYYRTRPGRTATALLAAVREYTGERAVDADEDGYYEEQYRVEGGSLVLWRLDQDQDGIPEAEVRFASGAPRSLSAGGLEYRYSSYPFLGEVGVQNPQSPRVYQLEPYRVSLVLFRGSPVIASPSRLSPLRLTLRDRNWPGERAVRSQSYALLEYAPGTSAVRRRFTLSAGAVLRMEENPEPQGRYAHIVDYARGVPVSGRRDLNGDGRYELSEQYSGGRLSALILDQDGNGRPLYRKEFTSEEIRSSWDYNQDGITDSVELERPGGEVVLEFSSRLDGVFDCRAVFRSGLLAAFEMGGQTLPVTPSSDRSLYWVGRPGGAAQAFLGLSDGLQRVGGRNYFLFARQGVRYVVAL
jgi:tetratricopeptide (TPR) repeat protein